MGVRVGRGFWGRGCGREERYRGGLLLCGRRDSFSGRLEWKRREDEGMVGRMGMLVCSYVRVRVFVLELELTA